MALCTTYGYINLAKNIYDLKAFRKSNDKAIKIINAINSISGCDTVFEYTTDKQVVFRFWFYR